MLIPYFGRLPAYAPLFFLTAAANPTITFKLFTDTPLDRYTLPANVLVHLILAGLLTFAYVGLIVVAIDLFYPFAGGMRLGPEAVAALAG